MFRFTITARDRLSKARAGLFHTHHGILQTPELAIVATDGEIKAIPHEIHDQLPLRYNIANTFHIYTKEILPEIDKAGEIHTFGNFQSVIATDSGGFQVFSLGFGKAHNVGKIGGLFPDETTDDNGTMKQWNHETSDIDNPVTITDDGVSFLWNSEVITLNPEKSMEIQHRIGADIMFAFDECTSPLNSKEYTATALDRTHRWIHRCIEAHKPFAEKQALFAIVQGGAYEDLRIKSAEYMSNLDVPGFGIGGSLGTSKEDMYRILEWTLPRLPDNKPRHLLGIGQIRDIFESVERGVDLFDCVIPTREARHKVVYTKKGKVAVRKMRSVDEPIDHTCECIACAQKITLATIAQLFTDRDPQAYLYATAHNIQFFADLMEEIRNAIANGTFLSLKEEYYLYY